MKSQLNVLFYIANAILTSGFTLSTYELNSHSRLQQLNHRQHQCHDPAFLSNTARYPNIYSRRIQKRKKITHLFINDASSTLQDKEESVQVWDGVLDMDTCEELHELAWEHNDRVESSIFTRRIKSSKSSDQSQHNEVYSKKWTLLERAIDSILSTIEINSCTSADIDNDNYEKEDDIMVVEYWSRQHHMNVDVHSDIDEIQFLEEGTVRTPKSGHILYLIVGNEILENGGGPTVIFTGKKKSWTRHEERVTSDIDASNGISPCDNSKFLRFREKVEMITVPAVDGRLVRFDGSMMHAVPRPSVSWLQKNGDRSKTINPAIHEYEDEDDYDDEDYFDVENEKLRSVLIFNTWLTKEGPAPKGVDPDPESNNVPSGIELSDEGLAAEDLMTDDLYGQDDHIYCNKFSHWKKELINKSRSHDDELIDTTPGQIPLLGNAARRGNNERFIDIIGHSSLQTAFTDLQNVNKLSVFVKDNSETY